MKTYIQILHRLNRCFYVFKNMYVYKHMYVTAVNERRGHKFEWEVRGSHEKFWKEEKKGYMMLFYNIKKESCFNFNIFTLGKNLIKTCKISKYCMKVSYVFTCSILLMHHSIYM